jgi:hypothetical protein
MPAGNGPVGGGVGGQVVRVEFLTSKGRVIAGSAYTWTAVTDVDGVAILTAPSGYAVPPGAASIRISFGGSPNYAATTTTQSLFLGTGFRVL